MQSTPTQIDVYWRPGCAFCRSLKRQLDKLGLERVEHNIWDDDEAAAIVRFFADGHETVPTVVIGDVGLVNPKAKDVLAVLGAEAPHLLPADVPHPDQGTVGKLVTRLLKA
jgi:glutaredoxin